MSRIYLFGASGHAKVIIEALESQNIKLAGLIDHNPAVRNLLDYHVYNSLPEAGFSAGDYLIISVGNNCIRKQLVEKIRGASFATAIHKRASISPRSSFGEGSVVMPNATVNADTKIGKHSILNTNCSVDHDCIISDFVHISPNAALAGNVKIGEGTHIGIGATIIQNLYIGKWATIGAGAVIIEDIPDYAVVVGNPGKIIKFNIP